MPSYGPYQVSGRAPVFLGKVFPNQPSMQVINRSLFRVWLNTDSSFSAGRGTPLEPLTSIQWNMKGDLWAVIDSSSPTGSIAQIVLSSDASDWAPSPADVANLIFSTGIVNQDAPQTLSFNFGTVLGANASSTVFDGNVVLTTPALPLAQYQSVFGAIKWANVSGLFNYLRVIVQYFNTDGSFQVGQDTFAVNPSFAGGATDQTFFRLPLRGQRVKVILTNMSANSGTFSYSMFTSYRPVDRPYFEESFGPASPFGYGSDGVLAFVNATIVAQTLYPIALHQGRVMVTFRNGATSVVTTTLSVSCTAVDLPDVNGFSFQTSAAIAIGSNLPQFELILPARPCKLTVTAAGSVAFNMAVIAQDR
jgi:hypothetical protein